MPTFDTADRFLRDHARLNHRQRERFQASVSQFVADLQSGNGFRKGLRVKGVRGKPNVFEMTWDGDGRATFSYGDSVLDGEPHIIWRRIGTHDIL